ncbi:prepilin-type N-terminal cleavage/methylation domain-containing protein [Lentisphaera marina]|uniref:type II secretion system protein n=1 Tax=Lentisphaera marina TaxID=1111041 RepID=UPI0023665FC3|nr:prepilin-type N-terminal cleavage/methylation domain-containing protein [Lentisphaera marina]MDD7983963.1 prepilin-type N-terminal cleavage/methylation domain-containing protein [Lentisphaera marina]
MRQDPKSVTLKSAYKSAIKLKNFTLIEVLVVVAIIGILASLLLPSLSKARGNAQRSVCVNNLKNISTAILMYPDDNNDYYPHGDSRTSNNTTWDDLLGEGRYDGRNITTAVAEANRIEDPANGSQIYYCPSSGIDYFDSNGRPIRTYSVNNTLMGRKVSVRQSEVANHSNTIMVYEHAGAWAQGWKAGARYDYSGVGDFHSYHQKTSFLVLATADGSVRNLHEASTSTAAAGSEDMWDLD